MAVLSPAGVTEPDVSFDEAEQELRTQAADQLAPTGARWDLQRRRGAVAAELVAAATAGGDVHPGDQVAIVPG
jgi:hypothetical protein